ncbi:MAG: tetratricopeptide repeat protein [Gammaproteobacteria bacterium]|nr:tetratricopeptide repeat protein [Gammaproteobacteria bacterium]MDE2345101.1 tetratricopeptide repeat protein [Gammaproteobacteria bacterium]
MAKKKPVPEQPINFLVRLKQHHLYGVMVGYAVVVGFLIQLVSRAFPYFGWSSAVPAVIIVLLLGFPVVGVLAWLLIEPKGQARPDTWQRRHWKMSAVVTAIVITLVMISGFYALQFSHAHLSALQAKTADTTETPASATVGMAPAAATAIPAKSIAVLPFENLNVDKKDAYFVAGIQDLILTKLADIGNLKVISRTSTMRYASHPESLTKIGEQLGVATILEGSVQKAGNQVLVNVQLIDARTDNHMWAQSYQRTLDNVFGVEGEVAQKVAAALDVRLTHTESTHLNTAPTQNQQAYDLFLRAAYYTDRGYSNFKPSDFEAAVKHYRAAVQQDPKFVLAWARLAQTSSLMAWNASPVLVANRVQLAGQAKQSVVRLEALAPNSVAAHLAQGYYDLYVTTDPEGALAAFQKAVELAPQNADALYGVGTAYYHLGLFNACAHAYQKAVMLDPRNLNKLSQLGHVYLELRHYGQAEQIFNRMLAIDPSSLPAMSALAYTHVFDGDLEGAQAVLNGAPASVRAEFRYSRTLAQLMLYRRDYNGARRVMLAAASEESSARDRWEAQGLLGDVEWAAGNRQLAWAHYQSAATLLETTLDQHPELRIRYGGSLSWAYARLGRAQEALAQAELFIKYRQASKSAQREQYSLLNMAQVQAQLGQVGQAIAGLGRLLATPAGENISVPLLKFDPTWDSIRHDPRFQALLKKYAKYEPAVIPAPATGTSAENAHG